MRSWNDASSARKIPPARTTDGRRRRRWSRRERRRGHRNDLVGEPFHDGPGNRVTLAGGGEDVRGELEEPLPVEAAAIDGQRDVDRATERVPGGRAGVSRRGSPHRPRRRRPGRRPGAPPDRGRRPAPAPGPSPSCRRPPRGGAAPRRRPAGPWPTPRDPVAPGGSSRPCGRAPADDRRAVRRELDLDDGNCAALGEGRAGAAIGVASFAVLVIGTGIGSGIVAGGRLLRGAHGGAGEIAFLPRGSDPWDERNRVLGAYETAVAGPAVRARLLAALGAGEATTLGRGAGFLDIATEAAAGDALAGRLLDEEARYVALGIAAISAVTDPEVVVLSGGVGAIGALLEPVREHVATLCARPPRLVTGLLGERAPLVGAIGLALDLAPRA
ncbi:MAG TPA: ROK family protein [Candidatus Nanopelagicales bacterium]|nr:ROK family protein [Candidatus Nanopelagicales bacterium]